MGDTAFIFDLDNTLLDTEALKSDMPELCHQAFPAVSPQLFSDTYSRFKTDHDGFVDMPHILHDIGQQAGLAVPGQEALLHWPEQIPYRNYLFDRDHTLIKSLGPERVFVLTLGDTGYQPMKIAGLGLPPYLAQHDHIRVTGNKDLGMFTTYIEGLRQQGFSKFTFVNDNIIQLNAAYEAAPKDVTPILFRHGPYADEYRLGDRGFPYQAIGEFARLWQVLKPGNVMLESRTMRPAGERK